MAFFFSCFTLATVALLASTVSAVYPGPDSCKPTLWNVEVKQCIGQSNRRGDEDNIYGEQMELSGNTCSSMAQVNAFPKNEDGGWSDPFDLISYKATNNGKKQMTHPQGGTARTNVQITWYDAGKAGLRTMFQWKYTDDGDGSIIMRGANAPDLCIYPVDGNSEKGAFYVYHEGACESQSAKIAVSCSNTSPWSTSTLTSTTATATTTTTTTTSSTTTNTVVGEIGRQQEKFSDIEALLESQIESTDKHVAALTADIGELKKVNEAQADQIAKLIATLAKVAGDGNTPSPPPSKQCDTGASAWEVPSVESDGVGSIDINACFGTITLRSSMCAVDPCVLNDRITALETKLAALADP